MRKGKLCVTLRAEETDSYEDSFNISTYSGTRGHVLKLNSANDRRPNMEAVVYLF